MVAPGPDGHRIDPDQLELLLADASPGEGGLEVRMRLDHPLDQLVLLGRHRRLEAAELSPVDERAPVQRDHDLEAGLRCRVEEDDVGLPLDSRAGEHALLRGLAQGDRDEGRTVVELPLPAHDRGAEQRSRRRSAGRADAVGTPRSRFWRAHPPGVKQRVKPGNKPTR